MRERTGRCAGGGKAVWRRRIGPFGDILVSVYTAVPCDKRQGAGCTQPPACRHYVQQPGPFIKESHEVLVSTGESCHRPLGADPRRLKRDSAFLSHHPNKNTARQSFGAQCCCCCCCQNNQRKSFVFHLLISSLYFSLYSLCGHFFSLPPGAWASLFLLPYFSVSS